MPFFIKFQFSEVGTVRCAVPARVQRAERMLDDMRTTAPVGPLERGAHTVAHCPYDFRRRAGVCPSKWR